MTKVYCIVSGKGGVGKTMFSINVSAALSELGKRVLLIDGNLTTPNVSVSLGIYNPKYTLHHVLKNEVNIKDAILDTEYGFDVVPSSLSIKDLIDTDPEDLPEKVMELLGLYDVIIIDSSASLGRETISAIKSCDETIIITTLEPTSLVDAYKAIKVCDIIGKPVRGVVINRYQKNDKYRISEVEMYLNKPVLGLISEDQNVRRSIEKRAPLVIAYPDSPASIDIKRIAAKLIGIELQESKIKTETEKKGILEKILSLFKR